MGRRNKKKRRRLSSTTTTTTKTIAPTPTMPIESKKKVYIFRTTNIKRPENGVHMIAIYMMPFVIFIDLNGFFVCFLHSLSSVSFISLSHTLSPVTFQQPAIVLSILWKENVMAESDLSRGRYN